MIITIGDIKVQQGEKKKGWLKITNDSGQPVEIPCIVVNGSEDGPKLLITAGIHGDEFEGIETILRLTEMLTPSAIQGAVITVPVVNMVGFQGGSRIAAYDMLDLNRSFPGVTGGYFSQQLARIIVDTFVEKLQPDVIIDLHGGGNDKFIGPVVSCPQLQDDENEPRLIDLAKATGIPLLWRSSGSSTTTFRAVSLSRKIRALIIEAGGGGGLNLPIVKKELTAITNVMKLMKMIPGTMEDLPESYTVFGGFFTNSDFAGFLRRKPLKVGDRLHVGDALGTMIDLQGNILQEIRSEVDGLMISYRTTPKVAAGDWLFWVGNILEEGGS